MKYKVVIGLLLISLLTGCRSVGSKMSDYKGDGRYFRTISKEDGGKIIYDTRTGVEYWNAGGYSITVLVDADGKPLIYEEYKPESEDKE